MAPPQNPRLCSPLSPPLDEAGAFRVCRLPNPKSQMTQEMKVAGLASGGSQVGLVADTDVSYFCSCTLILPASALKWIFPPPHAPHSDTSGERAGTSDTEEPHKRADLHNRKQRRVLSRRLFLDFPPPHPPSSATSSLLSFHLFVLVLYKLCIHVALMFCFFFPHKTPPLCCLPSERAGESAAASPE